MHRSTNRKDVDEDKDWTKAMYSLWHKWLCKSDENQWGDYIKDDFAKARSMTFDDWWSLMNQQAQPIRFNQLAFDEITTVEEFTANNVYPHTADNFSSRIFRIEFWAPKHVLHEELDKLIERFHKNHQSGHEHIGVSNLSFTLEKKASKRFVTTVETIWKVYEAAEGWRDDRRTRSDARSLAEIGRDCGLRTKGSPSDDKNQLMAQTVSRYIKWGRQIAEHLLVGEFPVYNR